MDRGTYSAASAGANQLRRLDVVTNNLANVNTPGFKKQILVNEVQAFDDTLAKYVKNEDPYAVADQTRTPGVVHARAVTDFSVGPMKHTGGDLDVAIAKPNQFFVVQGPNGQEYTRAGNFTLNEEGKLVTMDGFAAMGDGGEITVDGVGAKISQGGLVTTKGQEAGRLQVVEFADPQALERVGNSRFKIPEGVALQAVPVETPHLEAQALEMANVSAVSSVVELIRSTRGFELYTRTAQSIDEMNNNAISRVGTKR